MGAEDDVGRRLRDDLNELDFWRRSRGLAGRLPLFGARRVFNNVPPFSSVLAMSGPWNRS